MAAVRSTESKQARARLKPTKNRITALLIYSHNGSMRNIERMLRNQFIKVQRAQTCRQAVASLAGAGTPHLIFTDRELPDGTWANVLEAAKAAQSPVKVIVVVPAGEIKMNLEAIQRGAFDLIAPPFSDFDIAHITKSAVADVLNSRGASVPSLSPSSTTPSRTVA